MAVPFRRTSKTVKRKRRTHFKLQVPGMVECPSCGGMTLYITFVKNVEHIKEKKLSQNNFLTYLRALLS